MQRNKCKVGTHDQLLLGFFSIQTPNNKRVGLQLYKVAELQILSVAECTLNMLCVSAHMQVHLFLFVVGIFSHGRLDAPD